MVPLTVTVMLVVGYIFMGCVLFTIWESWDPLKSAYYCFITISTIGRFSTSELYVCMG